MPYYYGYDPTYFLILIGVVLSLMASARVKSTYAKFSGVRSMSGMTGEETARRILSFAGIYDVKIERVAGNLTDHYDPRTKTLRLSESVYGNSSVAAIGVAAHECGHAIQHDRSYAPLKIRSVLAPFASFGANLSWPLILVGLLLGGSGILIQIGIIMFAVAVFFQLVTLPVEFNASKRAIGMLSDTGILYSEEVPKARKVLSAAALTYVAAAATSILQLLRLLLLFGGRRDDSR